MNTANCCGVPQHYLFIIGLLHFGVVILEMNVCPWFPLSDLCQVNEQAVTHAILSHTLRAKRLRRRRSHHQMKTKTNRMRSDPLPLSLVVADTIMAIAVADLAFKVLLFILLLTYCLRIDKELIVTISGFDSLKQVSIGRWCYNCRIVLPDHHYGRL